MSWSEVKRAFDARSLAAAGALLLMAAALAIGQPVSVVVGGACVVIATVAGAYAPAGGLAAVIVTLPYFHRPVTFGSAELAVSELLLLAVTLGCGLRLAIVVVRARSLRVAPFERLGREARTRRYWLILPAALLIGALLVAQPFDPAARGAALREWRWTLFEPFVFLVLLVGFVATGRQQRTLAAAFVLSGVVIAAHGIADTVAGGGVAAESIRRLSAPFPHPNAFALYALRVTVFSIALVAFAPRRSAWLIAPAAVCVIAVLASFSRGALIALFLAVLLLGWRYGRRRLVVIVGVSAAAAAMLVVVAGGRMLSAFDGGSLSLRGELWAAAARMIRDRPVLGFGPDQFYYAYNPRYIEPTGWPERFTSHAHNLFLDAWVRLGIIGAALATLAMLGVARGAVNVAAERIQRRALAQAAIVALAATLIHGLVDNAYFSHDLALSAWLLGWFAFGSQPAEPVEGSA
jgi:O-antigen ligase